MGRTSWLESAFGPKREPRDGAALGNGLSSSLEPADLRLVGDGTAAEASLEAMSEGRYTHWARLCLLLVALILLGLFACPPHAYAHALAAISHFAAFFSTLA